MMHPGISGDKRARGVHCCNIPMASKRMSARRLTACVSAQYAFSEKRVLTTVVRVKHRVRFRLSVKCAVGLRNVKALFLSTKDRKCRGPGSYAPRHIGTGQLYVGTSPRVGGFVGELGFRE